MTLVDSRIEMFEGKARRIRWLPTLTLGYALTLTGEPVRFWLAILSIGGARLFSDTPDSEAVAETDDGPKLRPYTLFQFVHRLPW